MIPRSWLKTWLALVAVVATAAARVAVAAPFDPESADWEGLDDFVRIAREEWPAERVHVPAEVRLGDLSPEDALVFVHPMGTVDPAEIESFIGAGGRVALLDDYGSGDRILAHFGIDRTALPSNPDRVLRSNPALALAERPLDRAPPIGLEELRAIEPVVVNHGSGVADTGLLPLLVVRGRGEPDALFAVAGVFGKGRLLVAGDASIAINSMLRYPGNRSFVSAVVHYLAGRDGGARALGHLYVVVNDATVTGSFASSDSTPSPAARALETLRRGLPPPAVYAVAVATGLGIILWASSYVGRVYRDGTPRFARSLPLAAQGGFAGTAATWTQGAPEPALTELRRALEEQLAIRLTLERPVPHRDLAARLKSEGWLDAAQARELESLFATILRLEGAGQARTRWRPMGRRQAIDLVRRARELVATIDAARRGKVSSSP
jgi:hypothetical protein